MPLTHMPTEINVLAVRANKVRFNVVANTATTTAASTINDTNKKALYNKQTTKKSLKNRHIK